MQIRKIHLLVWISIILLLINVLNARAFMRSRNALLFAPSTAAFLTKCTRKQWKSYYPKRKNSTSDVQKFHAEPLCTFDFFYTLDLIIIQQLDLLIIRRVIFPVVKR